MKRFWSGILGFILALSAVMSAQTTTTQTTTTTTAKKARRKAATTTTADDIKALREMMEQQQQAQQAESSSTEQKATVDKLQSDMADVHTTLTNTGGQTQEEQKRVSGIEGTLARFQWGGDVRVRYENFTSQDNPGCVGLGV